MIDSPYQRDSCVNDLLNKSMGSFKVQIYVTLPIKKKKKKEGVCGGVV